MAEAHGLLRARATHDVDEVRRAETLARAVRRRQHLLRIARRVDALRGVEAHVAVAARLDTLAEVLEQRHPPARGRLAIAEQRIEALVLAPPSLRPRVLVLDELPAHPDVGKPVEHVRLGRRPVASRAANLLIVRLDASRQVGMEDIAHIRLVDAHPERDGGDHDHARLGHELVLVRLALRGVHPRMVGQRPHPGGCEQRRRLLGLLPRKAVDDAALARVRGDEAGELAFPLALHLHREADVRAVEAEYELLDRAREQLLGDVAARHLVGGRGQCRDGNPREERAQPAELRVLRPECRTPLRDAVRLVDGEQP